MDAPGLQEGLIDNAETIKHDPDGDEVVSKKDRMFLAWLRANGARFDSVDWPSCNTESRVRGAVARSDIATEEHMITIPHRLMMSEFHARADPDLGHVHRENERLLKNDNSLALYIMQETLKGEASFYWPYLQVLPLSRNITHWSEPNLADLQDDKLVRRSAARARHIRALYHDMMGILSKSYPGIFPVDRYTFELFDFAWSTVQARAFGKRLKCSALVPLADCLNHGNVQTKYDFDVEGNSVFRLFPSGTNRYPRGAEVLNSYGRRANDNLLLEYGFATLDNEWDAAEVTCCLPPHESLFDRRKACLRASGQHTLRLFRFRRDDWAVELLQFNRCVCLTESELDYLDAEHGAARYIETTHHDNCSSNAVSRGRERGLVDGGAVGEPVIGDGGGNEDYVREATAGTFPFRALSAENELLALTEIVMCLLEARDTFATTLEHDERLLQKIQAVGDTAPELVSAMNYRVTIKRVIDRQLEMSERAIAFVQEIAKKEAELPADDDDDPGARGRFLAAATAANRATGNSGRRVQADIPHSFAVYLEELETVLLLPKSRKP